LAETNKTEKATPKKRRDERKKGNAFQSRDVVSVVILILGFLLISKLGGFIMIQIKGLYLSELTMMSGLHDLTIPTCLKILRETVLVFFITTAPILITLAVDEIGSSARKVADQSSRHPVGHLYERTGPDGRNAGHAERQSGQ
jgi:flagellar biosynthetic protein FlhB